MTKKEYIQNLRAQIIKLIDTNFKEVSTGNGVKLALFENVHEYDFTQEELKYIDTYRFQFNNYLNGFKNIYLPEYE
ncbi:MAG: hypothetical protein QXL94_04040 [Candidatus Parvarchaeum sp.]